MPLTDRPLAEQRGRLLSVPALSLQAPPSRSAIGRQLHGDTRGGFHWLSRTSIKARCQQHADGEGTVDNKDDSLLTEENNGKDSLLCG